MNIVDIKLDELKPYENNPRNNEEAVEPVANSIFITILILLSLTKQMFVYYN